MRTFWAYSNLHNTLYKIKRDSITNNHSNEKISRKTNNATNYLDEKNFHSYNIKGKTEKSQLTKDQSYRMAIVDTCFVRENFTFFSLSALKWNLLQMNLLNCQILIAKNNGRMRLNFSSFKKSIQWFLCYLFHGPQKTIFPIFYLLVILSKKKKRKRVHPRRIFSEAFQHCIKTVKKNRKCSNTSVWAVSFSIASCRYFTDKVVKLFQTSSSPKKKSRLHPTIEKER